LVMIGGRLVAVVQDEAKSSAAVAIVTKPILIRLSSTERILSRLHAGYCT